MSTEENPNRVFFIHGRAKDKNASVESGDIIHANYEEQYFVVDVRGEYRKCFNFTDYHRLIFPEYEKAEELVNRQPEIGQNVFLICKDKKMTTVEVVDHFDIPYIYFKSGKRIEVTEAKKTYFVSREEANAALNR